jgi:hypothetical protein
MSVKQVVSFTRVCPVGCMKRGRVEGDQFDLDIHRGFCDCVTRRAIQVGQVGKRRFKIDGNPA